MNDRYRDYHFDFRTKPNVEIKDESFINFAMKIDFNHQKRNSKVCLYTVQMNKVYSPLSDKNKSSVMTQQNIRVIHQLIELNS